MLVEIRLGGRRVPGARARAVSVLVTGSIRSRLPLALLALMAALPLAHCGRKARPELPAPRSLGLSIVEENALPGAPRSVWDTPRRASVATVEGFSTQFSVAPGDTVDFKVKASAAARMEIYRLGYYAGMGARQVVPEVGSPAIELTNLAQDVCARRPNVPAGPLPLQAPPDRPDVPDCSNWAVSGSWSVPASAASGVYLARVYDAADRDDASHIPFVVREADGSRADVLYQLSDATWQAYNRFDDVSDVAGNDILSSLYDAPVRTVSYDRPWRNRVSGTGAIWGPDHYLFEIDLPLIRFLERNGISVSYAGSADFEASAALLEGRKVFLSAGHPEYVSGSHLSALENAASAGTHMIFLSGNFAYFKTRFEPGGRVLNMYKAGNGADPRQDEDDWSGVWRDTRSDQSWTRPASQPARCSNGLTGVAPAAVNNPGAHSASLVVPGAMTGLRLWRHTTCAEGQQDCTLGLQNVGFETDVRADRYYEAFVGSQPAGLISVSATPLQRMDMATPWTLAYGTAPFTDEIDFPGAKTIETEGLLPMMLVEATLHRRSSGALVFSGASFFWSHALDEARDGDDRPEAVERDVQQATLNLLADMNVQPTSLADDLIPTSASSDETPPSSQLLQLNQASGLVTGSASDLGGGVVAAVEVSFDDGQTWHGTTLTRASGETSWSYMSVVPANVTPRVRAVDDSGNIEAEHLPDVAIAASEGLFVTTVGAGPTPYPGGMFTQQIPTGAGGVVTSTPGLTALVPMNINDDGLTDLLTYNRETGEAAFAVAVPGSPGVRRRLNGVSAAPGWTSVVPLEIGSDHLTDLLSYNATTGLSVYSLGSLRAGVATQTIVSVLKQGDCRDLCTQGWTSIVPMNINNDGVTDLLFYNAATGLAISSVGDRSAGGAAVQRTVAVVHAAPGWTAIVPMHMNADSLTDLVSYNGATGLAVYSLAGPGAPDLRCGVPGHAACPRQRIDHAPVQAAPGWTSIVPMNLNGDDLTDLLSYNAASGRAYFSVGIAGGTQQVVGAEATGAARWTSIVAMKLSNGPGEAKDLLFYR